MKKNKTEKPKPFWINVYTIINKIAFVRENFDKKQKCLFNKNRKFWVVFHKFRVDLP